MPRPHGKPLLGQLSGKWYSTSVDQSDFPELAVDEAFDEQDEEEEVEIKISASGSVLTPSTDPYDKLQKLKQANAQLMAADLPPRAPGKVRFNDAVSTAEDDGEGSQNVIGVEALKTSPGKVLLVTVPTGFSQDLEEVNSEEEIIDETENKNDAEKNEKDCHYDSPNIRKAITFNDFSVDMKSVDDDYGETVEDLTTTLVSLCRMTSECEDTNLENNICKYAKVAMKSECEYVAEEVEETNENTEEYSVEEPANSDDAEIKTDDVSPDGDPADEDEPKEPIIIVKRVASARMAARAPIKKDTSPNENARPSTSPGKRICFKNQWATAKLPSYNGLRSEYGLSAEQLEERKKRRAESAKLRKQQKEELYKEERRRQKENEQMFANWLVKKKKEAAMKAARRKQLQSAFHFKTLPAPTNHLEKLGVLRKKVLARREHTCFSLEEFFKNAKPHEQKTYKIYLGLCVE